MKKIYILVIGVVLSFNGLGQQWEWAKGFAVSNNFYNTKITPDNFGGFYISTSHAGASIIIKFDISGNELWRKQFSQNLQIQKSLITSTGDILGTGDFADTINIDGNFFYAVGERDGFLLRLDSSGALKSFKQIAGLKNEIGNDIFIDKNENIFLTGTFSNHTFFEGQELITNGNSAAFLSKFSPQGSLLFTTTADALDSTHSNSGFKIKTDEMNNIFLLGFYDVIQIDTFSLYTGTPYQYQFLAKFDSMGKTLFLNYVMDRLEQFNNFWIIDSNLYFTGDGSWTNGGWTKTKKYSNSGNMIWVHSFRDGPYYGYNSNNLVPNKNGFYTVGSENNPNMPSWNRIYSLMISNYSYNGLKNNILIKSAGYVDGYDITTLDSNTFIIVGYTPDTITLGGSTITKMDGNLFIAKFSDIQVTNVNNHGSINNNFSIHPNPSSGKFQIQFNEMLKQQDVKVYVYDVMGKSVYQSINLQINNSSTELIDLTGNAKGIYFIEVSMNGERYREKVIIQ